MKAAIYARVSSEKQDVDLSISAQMRALRDYASRNGYEVIKEFMDQAESGRTSARPAFREMIAMARRQSKPFDTILVYKYSRFARNREDSIVFKTLLKKVGVRVISITEPADETASGKLFEAMIECFDEFYSSNLGEEVTRGMRESAMRGFYVKSFAPYGYRKVRVNDGGRERTKLEPEPHQAQIVSRIFGGILQGKGLTEIVKELNNEGIAGPRGRGWIKTTLHQLVTNEVYTGTLVWSKTSTKKLEPVRFENAWPAVADKDTFNRAQQLLRERAPVSLHPKRASSHFLLSGIAKCGYCGKALIGHDAKSGKFSYYVCGTLAKRGAGSCPSLYLNSHKFEGIVINKIKDHILTRKNLVELVRIVNEELDTLSIEHKEHLQSIDDEINELNLRLDRLYDVLEMGKAKPEDLMPRILQHKYRLEKLQDARHGVEQKISERKIELADTETVTRYVEDLRKLISDSPLVERKAFIRSFVRQIEVKGDQALLTYTLPMPPEGITEEKTAVLSTVQYGGR